LLTNQKISVFLEKTAAGTPVPGGGSVSALSGALGAGLAEMVANLTIAKKGYETVENEMKEIAETLQNLREKLVTEVDKDSNAYKDVLTAFKLPKDTQEEKEQRAEAIQDAMKNAARVPLGVANDALQVMDLAEKAIRNGNRAPTSNQSTTGTTPVSTSSSSPRRHEIGLAKSHFITHPLTAD